MKLFNLNDTIEVDILKEYDAVMKETIETIEGLSASDKLRYKLEAEEDAKRIYKTEIYDAKQEGEALGIVKGEALGIEKGNSRGIEVGKEEGSFIAKRNIVNYMKNNGADNETISKSTGIDIEEVESLLNV